MPPRPAQLAALRDALDTVRGSWERANAILCTRLGALLPPEDAAILPAVQPPPGLTWELACDYLRRAVGLLDPFPDFWPAPGWCWLAAGTTAFNPDRPGFLVGAEDLLRTTNPASDDAGFFRREFVGPTMRHAGEVRRFLDSLDEKYRAEVRARGICFSEDFRSLCWGGEQFIFTPKQAACCRALWKARESGAPAISGMSLLDAAESSQADSARPKLANIFKEHPAWNKVIVSVAKGAYQLADPPAS